MMVTIHRIPGVVSKLRPAKPANLDDGDVTIRGVMGQLHQTS